MQNYNQAIYEATGYKVVSDITEGVSKESIPQEVIKFVEGFNSMPANKQSQMTTLLARYIREYPQYFETYLVLFNYYVSKKKWENVKETMEMAVKQFPESIIFQLHYARVLISQKKWEELRHILGEDLTLKSAFPEKKTFTEDEYAQYHTALLQYHMVNEQKGKAHKILQHFLNTQGESQTTVQMAEIVHEVQSSIGFVERLSYMIDDGIRAEVNPVPALPALKTEPTYHHTREIQLLKEYSTENLPKDIIEQIISLPKETLREDLENYFRYMQYFIILDETSSKEEVSEFLYDQIYHVLILLSAIDAQESLPIILDSLRHDWEGMECLYAGSLETLQEAIYILGKSQLPVLISFAKESNVEAFGKEVVFTTLEQVGLYYPERRNEVIAYLEDLLQEYLIRKNEENFADSLCCSIIIGKLASLQSIKSLSLVKEIKEAELYQERFMGDWDMIELAFEHPILNSRVHTMPENVFEFYDQSYKERKSTQYSDVIEAGEYILKVDLKKQGFDSFKDAFSNLFERPKPNNTNQNSSLFQKLSEPSYTVSSGKKVPPNEPCPCGSGKKYKKCCRSLEYD